MCFIIIFELTLKRKCVKWCKQLKYYHEIRLKRQINLRKHNYKRLNPHISKDESLNWSKILKRPIQIFVETWGIKQHLTLYII